MSYTRANSYVDSPSVPDTGTNGSAESHGHANPYSDADAIPPPTPKATPLPPEVAVYAKVSPAVVEVRGPRGKSLGFLVEVSEPNPNARYVATRYSTVRGKGYIVVTPSPTGVGDNQPSQVGRIFAVDQGFDFAIVELRGR